jgi:hypothetical protein
MGTQEVTVVNGVHIELGVIHMLFEYQRKNNSPGVMHVCGREFPGNGHHSDTRRRSEKVL